MIDVEYLEEFSERTGASLTEMMRLYNEGYSPEIFVPLFQFDPGLNSVDAINFMRLMWSDDNEMGKVLSWAGQRGLKISDLNGMYGHFIDYEFLKQYEERWRGTIYDEWLSRHHYNVVNDLMGFINEGLPFNVVNRVEEAMTKNNEDSLLDFCDKALKYKELGVTDQQIWDVLGVIIFNPWHSTDYFFNFLITFKNATTGFLDSIYDDLVVYDKRKFIKNIGGDNDDDILKLMQFYDFFRTNISNNLDMNRVYLNYLISGSDLSTFSRLWEKYYNEDDMCGDIAALVGNGSTSEQEVDEFIHFYGKKVTSSCSGMSIKNGVNLKKIIRQYQSYLDIGMFCSTIMTAPDIFFGVNPQLTVDNFDIEMNPQGYSNINIRSENRNDKLTLLGVFGKRWEEWVSKFGGNIHDASQVIPQREFMSIKYKWLADFLFANLHKRDDVELNSIASNWPNLPDELKKNPNLDQIVNYFMVKLYNEESEFGKKAVLFGLDNYDYIKYKKIYDSSQNVPLPEWAQVNPVNIDKYTGYFLQRSDMRGLFIGNYSF